LQQIQQWCKNNPEKVKQTKQKWLDNNKEFRKEVASKSARKNYFKQVEKLASNNMFKLTANLRSLLNVSLKNNGYSKKSKTVALLGAEFEIVQQHLILSAMNNYGEFYSPFEKYEIDHIIPCSSAKTEEELIKLQHYTNLQYLTVEDNISKSNKLNWTMKDSLTIKKLTLNV
jgi:hypothetical protein